MSNKVAISPGAGSASVALGVSAITVEGTAVDLMGYQGAMAVVSIIDWTDGTHVFTLEDSDDNSTFGSAAARIDGTPPTISATTNEGKSFAYTYNGTKRYLRWVVTVTGSPSTGCSYAAYIWPASPKHVG